MCTLRQGAGPTAQSGATRLVAGILPCQECGRGCRPCGGLYGVAGAVARRQGGDSPGRSGAAGAAAPWRPHKAARARTAGDGGWTIQSGERGPCWRAPGATASVGAEGHAGVARTAPRRLGSASRSRARAEARPAPRRPGGAARPRGREADPRPGRGPRTAATSAYRGAAADEGGAVGRASSFPVAPRDHADKEHPPTNLTEAHAAVGHRRSRLASRVSKNLLHKQQHGRRIARHALRTFIPPASYRSSKSVACPRHQQAGFMAPICS